MDAAQLVLRVVGATLLGLLILVLLRMQPRDLKVRTAVWLAASVAAFLLTSMPRAEAIFGTLIYPLTALCATHPVWFWLFTLALFSDCTRLRTAHILCVAGVAVCGVFYQSQLPPAGEVGAGVRLLGGAFGLASLVFAGLAPITVFLGTAGDLDTQRLCVRKWFVPGVGLYLAAVAATQFFVLVEGRPTPEPFVLMNLLVIVVVAALALASFVRFRTVNWFATPAVQPAALSRTEQRVLDELSRRFVSERMYARESLTITELAAILGTQEHILRRVINQALGFRNFNDFLHHHRLTEAAARLRDPASRRIPVLTIALEAGYGSIGPFNRAFKEHFGVTPTQYRREPHADFEIGKGSSAFG
jgi:AraC-like DNA-binding protein